MENKDSLKGIIYALAAFSFWGLIPIFWKQIVGVDAFELLGHRMIWGGLMLGLILALSSGKKSLTIGWKKNNRKVLIASGLCIGFNWIIFIWAVQNKHIVEVSLGYFINPLVNVLFGVVFLKEKLRHLQWGAVGIAIIGISFLVYQGAGSPWISISLAGTFALYGLLRKFVKLSSSEGLFFEMSLVTLLYIPYLVFLYRQEQLVFLQLDGLTQLLVFLTGAVTIFPLFCFGNAVKGLRLSTLGIIQYLVPSLHLIIGVVLYKEVFTSSHVITFACIWTALLIYSVEGFYNMRKKAVESSS